MKPEEALAALRAGLPSMHFCAVGSQLLKPSTPSPALVPSHKTALVRSSCSPASTSDTSAAATAAAGAACSTALTKEGGTVHTGNTCLDTGAPRASTRTAGACASTATATAATYGLPKAAGARGSPEAPEAAPAPPAALPIRAPDLDVNDAAPAPLALPLSAPDVDVSEAALALLAPLSAPDLDVLAACNLPKAEALATLKAFLQSCGLFYNVYEVANEHMTFLRCWAAGGLELDVHAVQWPPPPQLRIRWGAYKCGERGLHRLLCMGGCKGLGGWCACGAVAAFMSAAHQVVRLSRKKELRPYA